MEIRRSLPSWASQGDSMGLTAKACIGLGQDIVHLSVEPAVELFHVKLSTPPPDKDDILLCGSLFRQPAPVDRQQLPETLGLSTLFPATRPWICPHLGVEFRLSLTDLPGLKQCLG